MPGKRYDPEFKSRAIELCLRAIRAEWSIARFARRAGVPKGTMMEWLSEDAVFDRYKRAMEVKALALPDKAIDVVNRIIHGKAVYNAKGELTGREFLDPKAGRVALQHYEFRMMREIKSMYQPSKTVEHKRRLEDLSDEEVDNAANAILTRAMEKLQSQGQLPPPDDELNA